MAAQEMAHEMKEIERLGRQRPAVFKTAWVELGFCFSLLASVFMAEFFISGFNIILPVLSESLSIPAASRTWPASVFSMVTGAFLLPMGRLADMFGGYIVFTSGLAWFLAWSIIGGFSQNSVMLIVCRALAGLGPAGFLPAGIMLLGSAYRPGPRKNIVFSLYAACAPLGFFAGILIGGISGQVLPWSWYFWIGAMVIFVVFATALVTVPRECETNNNRMDWLGAATIVPGLLLVIFAITESSHATNGWRSPSVCVTIILGGLLLVAAVYVEGWVASSPLLPFSLFRVKHMTPLIVALFLLYGVFGIFLFYSSFFIQDVIGETSLVTAVWFTPMAVGGLVLATIGGLVMHMLPGTVLMLLSGVGYVVSSLLFALMPTTPNYWAWVFPAMVCGTLGIDVSYTVSNVFISTSLPHHEQGLAGATINTMLFLGISFWLGVADMISTGTASQGTKASYQNALWLGVALSGVAMILMIGFVRIDSAKSDLTLEEKKALEVSSCDVSCRTESLSGCSAMGV